VLLRLSRTKVYALIRSEALVSVKIGGARRIPMAALVAYVAALVDEAA
jgi:excisionase family DNA binding protein